MGNTSGKRISDSVSAGNDLARWADIIITNGTPVETLVKPPHSVGASQSFEPTPVEVLENELERKIVVRNSKADDARTKRTPYNEENPLLKWAKIIIKD